MLSDRLQELVLEGAGNDPGGLGSRIAFHANWAGSTVGERSPVDLLLPPDVVMDANQGMTLRTDVAVVGAVVGERSWA